MLSVLQSAPIYIISFVVVLGLIVTIHELGHFLAAKACGVAIDRFSIGFGRAIASWRDRSGVEWRLGWIPLGGYVRFSGDVNDASVPDQNDLEALRAAVLKREGAEALKRYFHFKPIWQRAVVTVAGPIANFLLSITLFTVLLMTIGDQVVSPKISKVMPNSAAARAGFMPGDMVTGAAGRTIRSFGDLEQVVAYRGGVQTEFVVDRGGRSVRLTATPDWKVVPNDVAGDQRIGMLGIQSPDTDLSKVWVRYGPAEALKRGVQRTWDTLSTSVYVLGRMITGQMSAEGLRGPLGIAQISGKMVKLSTEGATPGAAILNTTVNLVQLAAMISVGVGFMNLLPIPVLDGGHLLFYAYEAVAKRPLAAKVQEAGFRVGLALVFGLMLFATWNDLQRLHVFKIIGGLLS